MEELGGSGVSRRKWRNKAEVELVGGSTISKRKWKSRLKWKN